MIKRVQCPPFGDKWFGIKWTFICILLAYGLFGAQRLTAQAKGPAATSTSKSDARKENPLIDSIRGADLFKAYCASCHGTDATGGGPMAAALKTKPTDLTRISARNGGTFPFERIRKIVSGEAQPASGHGSREMPVWGPIFSQVTRDMDLGRVRVDNLTRYLRDIQPMKVH